VLACVAALASCDRCGGATPAADSGAKDASVEPARDANADALAPPLDAATPADAGSQADAAAGGDAGASSCRLVYGPAEQPFRGPAAMMFAAGELRLVANDAGKPRIYPVPVTTPAAAPVVPPKPASFVGMRWPPCELAGRWAYCQAPGGTVYRTTLGASDTKAVAQSRSGTRIAAAALGSEHAAVATLESRRTTEGEMLQAFVTVDEGETTRLSEEGAGATTLRMIARGDHALAMYLDTRTAMVPVHARPLSMRGTSLALGEDAVLYVAGAPERGVDFAVSATKSSVFVLLPMSHETSDFGMASIPVADPPKEDVKALWSYYPNGLDPAPIGASVTAADASSAYVARVRPREREPGSPRVLELGRVDDAGVFSSLGIVASGKPITDVAVATDAFGAVWILYGDPGATWLERRVCP